MKNAPAPFALRLSGPPALLEVAWHAERRFQLLAVLALHGGEWVARDRLATLFWPERSNAEARRNLRKVIFRARQLPGTEALQADENAVRWPVPSDVQSLQAALRDGRLGDALPLHRGPLLAGLDDPALPEFSDWLAAERRRFDTDWRQAALAHLATLADPGQRRALAERLLALDAFDEDALAVLIAAEQALGHAGAAQRHYADYARRLATTLGVEPARALRDSLLSAAAPSAEGDGFVGRRLELAEIEHRLRVDGERVLVLLGPGGVGKSRLAQAALARLAPAFSGGPCWVELQDLADNAAVAARLAQRLGLELAPGQDALKRAATRLAGTPTLLVLDNAEHLPELPLLLQALLAAPGASQFIVTSRSRLPPPAAALPLGGLAVPDEDSRDLEAAQTFDAVRLFAGRARQARRDFDLAAHLGDVIRIVELVAGLPLAIELAAGWVRLLPPAEIARDLEASIDLLRRDPGSAALPLRDAHASMHATLDASWALLVPREREALAALSVFAGGFTRSAAQAVAGVSMPLLSALVDRSLLAVDDSGRFGLHPLVQADAAERLAGDADAQRRLQVRHAEFHAGWLARLAASRGGDHRKLMDTLQVEQANLLRAWQLALDGGRADLLAEMAPTLQSALEMRGRLGEGIATFREALRLRAPAPAQDVALARIRHALALLLFRRHELAAARESADAGLALAEASGDARALSGCLGCIGSTLSAQGKAAQARPYFERALAVARSAGLRHAEAMSLGSLGIVAKKLGAFDEALALYRQALAIDREIGDPIAVAIRLNSLGGLHAERDDWAPARRWYDEGLQLAAANGLTWLQAYLGYGVGLAEFELGLVNAAEQHLLAARDAAGRSELQGMTIAAEGVLGRVATARGDLAGALRHLRDAAAAARRLDETVETLTVLLYFGEWLRAAGRDAAAAQVWQAVARHEASEAGLRDSALRWLARLAPGADAAALTLQAAEALLDSA